MDLLNFQPWGWMICGGLPIWGVVQYGQIELIRRIICKVHVRECICGQTVALHRFWWRSLMILTSQRETLKSHAVAKDTAAHTSSSAIVQSLHSRPSGDSATTTGYTRADVMKFSISGCVELLRADLPHPGDHRTLWNVKSSVRACCR